MGTLNRIKTVKGDCLEAKGYIVHGCNTLGVMGSGIAKGVKSRFPEAFDAYQKSLASTTREKAMGSISYVHNPGICIINAITQFDCGNDKNKTYVDYPALYNAFDCINTLIRFNTNDLPKVLNFPMIGCGLANGKWNVVSELIEDAISDDIELVLYVL